MIVIARLLAVGIFLGSAGLAAQAQTAAHAAPTRIRGTILSLEGHMLAVTTREGQVAKITLEDKLTVLTVKKLELSAITVGAYIGTTAQPGPNGALTALEVHVFPETARGAGEGHRPWDLAPNSSMTNARVDAVEPGPAGRLLTLSYRGGSVKVLVPPGAPVVTPAPATREDLKPGQAVLVFATPAPDSTFSAARIYVAKDGIAPPM